MAITGGKSSKISCTSV